ncbi:SPOR domain-containing protein [Leisingera aquaemixtae]|uniref:SPOR domain-containing protein n=1 Tax=Leisingera aquaemixtae TaxID=1396826 RepID=UPI0021A2F448|nr:SPOR domain-containing protein [Leisingera aquaemixtae]UWQ47079.1 SPOR domain-containing protein [Leisingera aquaemixtae]
MKITRIIALAIITGASGAAGVQAQTLRPTSPPAEYPPASYDGRQFVDSRGCVYIRAGIDGNVTWVPQVTRSRKQICGFQPTQLAGTTQQQPRAAAPELITLEPSQQPAQTAAPAPAASAPAAASPPPQVAATAKPRRTPQTASARPAPAAATAPAVRKVVQAAPAPASAPAAAAPQSSVLLTPNTRVVQTHIYQERRLSNSFQVPPGYRPVWTDGRLNPQRAVRTVRPAVVTGAAQVPPGYLRVEREDGRLNPMRGLRSPQGDAQMARVWNDGVPRRLVQLPLDRPTVRLPRNARRSPAEAKETGLRLSTRSAPGAKAPDHAAAAPRYVRAATYADADQARAAARKLAATGLPVRLGTVSRKGQPYKVVMAGPYRDEGQAAAALAKAQQAGFNGARLSK